LEQLLKICKKTLSVGESDNNYTIKTTQTPYFIYDVIFVENPFADELRNNKL